MVQLTLCIRETTKRVLLQDEQNAAFHQSTLFVKVKKIVRQMNTLLFKNYYLTPLDMYNGLSQVYCIKPEGRIH